MRTFQAAILVAALAAAVPVIAQKAIPGAPDASRVAAGDYAADSRHSQVAWSLNHYGFNAIHGLLGGVTGTLSLDPAKPQAASVSVEIPVNSLQTSVAALIEHILKPDMLDAAQFPTAKFRSTSVVVDGSKAKITGDLTLHGVTKPVVLDARFIGAGTNPMNKKATVGFEATASINRSDFGIAYAIPNVADRVDLQISVAFERAAG